MSVTMILEAGTCCPRCGDDDGLMSLEIRDPRYVQANSLTPSLAADISEDGVFDFLACINCGFKWVHNEECASTSQIRAALLSHYISTIHECTVQELDDIISDLFHIGAIKNDVYGTFTVTTGPNYGVRLDVLRVISNYLQECDVNALVDAYNTVYSEVDLNEAFYPNDRDDQVDLEETGRALSVGQVLADD